MLYRMAAPESPRPRRVTDPGYHKGRTPANKGKKYGSTIFEARDVLRIIRAIKGSGPAQHRHRAQFAFLWRTGVRLVEVPFIREMDLDEAAGVVHIRRPGHTTRDAFVFGSQDAPDWTWQMMRPWLEARSGLGIVQSAPLFCIAEGPTKGGPLGDASSRMYLKNVAKAAGLHGRFELSGFRATLAAELFRNELSVGQIQRQLGHASLSTTLDYLERVGAITPLDDVHNYVPDWRSDD